MQNLYCPNCSALRGFKRSVGVGTILAVFATGGLWLFLLPFYPKRCIACGSKQAGKVKYKKSRTQVLKSVKAKKPARVKSRTNPLLNETIEIRTDFEPSAKPNVSGESVWIPRGNPIKVAGYNIDCGMLYCGKDLPAASGWGTDPALINPKLPVSNSSPNRDGQAMGYWPSYSDIAPECRSAYLEWLASDRSNPDAYIGYIFLYFYGLERRALIDLRNNRKSPQELPLIKTEVKRLLSIYHNNDSFRNYASSFLDTFNALDAEDKLYRGSPPSGFKSYDFPSGLKIGLGQMVADNVPLPAEWALAWVECRPYYNLRTPATRCHDEFKRLFEIRYKEKYGEGLTLKPGKEKLTVSYFAASASLRGRTEFSLPGLFDISADDKYLAQLSALAEKCTDELDAYSRYLGRNQGKKDALEAMALLPAPILIETTDYEQLDSLRSWLATTLAVGKGLALIDSQELLEHLPSFSQEKIGKRELTSIAQLLSKLCIGIEPDVRFGATSVLADTVCIFIVPDDAAAVPSPEYSAASVILHLAANVSGADGAVSPEEEQHLEERLESWLHLNEEERQRLKAHTQWLLTATPKLTGLKKRLALLKQTEREAVGKFLVNVAQADGFIDPEEIKTLTKIYKMLDLDTTELFSHAHAAATEPVTISKDSELASGHPIPELPDAEGYSVLDTSSVEAKLAETAAVTALLKNIFEEEEPIEEAKGSEIQIEDESVFGLSQEQANFMKILTEKPLWPREELEAIAAESDLLLDGALESLNDAAFEEFDEPFFEGEDPIVINQDVAKEVCNAHDRNPA